MRDMTERTTAPLLWSGEFMTRFILACACDTLDEAKRVYPELTGDQLQAIQKGEAEIVGSLAMGYRFRRTTR